MNLKPGFQAKFLQHLNKRKQSDEGFTLIELLVVIIIIGILAAIALPSLLGQANKARQSEARNNVGALNRAQQGFQLEKLYFATDIIQMGAGVQTQTDNYQYDIYPGTSTVAGQSKQPLVVTNYAEPLKDSLKAYAGIVGTLTQTAGGTEALTTAVACESNKATGTGITITGPNDGGAASLDCAKVNGGSYTDGFTSL